MRFNALFFISGFLLLLTATLFDVNLLDYERPIPFSRWKTITLNDFKGFNRPGQTLEGISEFAFIKTSREIEYKDKIIRVTSYFHPSRSYVFQQDLRSPDLLRHELYHFFITEYFSRMIRREIKDNNVAISSSFVNALNKQYTILENLMQRQYDEESYHSYIASAQRAWEEKIDQLLGSFADYADTDIKSGN